MTDDDTLDRYFTQKMVGEVLLVTMGPSGRRPAAPPHGVALNLPGGRAELIGLAARSLWTPEPLQALAGRPFSLPALLTARRGLRALGWTMLAVAVLVAWTALLLGVVWPWLQA